MERKGIGVSGRRRIGAARYWFTPSRGGREFRTRVVCVAGACLLSLVIAGCGGSDDDGGSSSGKAAPGVTDDAVKFGHIYDQTGPTVASQQPLADGLTAFIKKTNDAGGVAGRQIELLTHDTKYTAELGLQGLKRFTSQTPVLGLVGSLNGGTDQIPSAPIIEREKMPAVGPQAMQKVVQESGNPYIFSVTCDYADQADIVVPYAEQVTKATKPRAATLTLTTPSGAEWTDLIDARVTKAGGTFLGHYEIEPTATQADVQAQQIADKKPDWISIHAAPEQAAVMLKSLAKFDVDIPVLGSAPIALREVWLSAPEAVRENYYSVGCYTPGETEVEGTADMLAAAEKYGYGKELNTSYVQGWVTGMVTVAALERAGKDLTRESFIAALEGLTDFPTGGLSANISFGPDKRDGLSATRPYRFDFDAGKMVPEGAYEDWAEYLSFEYN